MRRKFGGSSTRSGTVGTTAPPPISRGIPTATRSGADRRLEPETVRRYHEAFPDLHFELDELIVAGDTVVLRAMLHGTDTGGYVGRPPTGRAGKEWVVTIMHFEHDRVVREWIGAHRLGLFIELGVVENPWPS